jgi:hypothetical protein
MAQTHPHADATYRVIERPDKSFAAEVIIPGMYPTLISGFATEDTAHAWIAKHKKDVEDYTGGWRRKKKNYDPPTPPMEPATPEEPKA